MLRCKMMEPGEAVVFQQGFEAITAGAGLIQKALLREAGSLTAPGVVLVIADDTTLIESLSPGGWSDCDDAAQRKWIMLAGDNAVVKANGLTLGL